MKSSLFAFSQASDDLICFQIMGGFLIALGACLFDFVRLEQAIDALKKSIAD